MASRTQTADEIIKEFLDEHGYELHFFTEEEAWEAFDGHARFALGMSGEEFLRRWDAGELRDPDLHVRVEMVRGLIPLVRPEQPDHVDE